MSEAAALQEELRDADIEPWAWVLNQSLAKTGTGDPVLLAKVQQELRQVRRIRDGLAQKMAVVPWLPEEPRGGEGLHRVLTGRVD